MSKKVLGKCSHCGGIVSIPLEWMSVNPPIASCESCGAVVDDLPVIKTVKQSLPGDAVVSQVGVELKRAWLLGGHATDFRS